MSSFLFGPVSPCNPALQILVFYIFATDIDKNQKTGK